MALTVSELIDFLGGCNPDDRIVIRATLADGTVLGVDDITVGTGQRAPNGTGVEVCFDWEPGAETLTSAQ